MAGGIKDNFIVHTEFEEDVFALTDEEAGQLFKALFKYARTGEADGGMDRIVAQTFKPMRRRMDYDTEQYSKVKEARIQAGRAGASKRWDDSKAMANDSKGIAKDSKAMASDSKNTVTVTDTVTDTDINTAAAGTARAYLKFYEANIGVISPTIAEEAETYITDDGMPDELIELALKRSVDSGAKNWRYAKKILNSWLEKGIKTAEQAKAETVEFKNRVNRPRGDPRKEFEQREYTQAERDRRKLDIVAEMEEAAGG